MECKKVHHAHFSKMLFDSISFDSNLWIGSGVGITFLVWGPSISIFDPSSTHIYLSAILTLFPALTRISPFIVQSNLALRNFLVTTKKFLKVKSSLFQTFNQSKGQLISECLFEKNRLDQNTNEKFDRFCPAKITTSRLIQKRVYLLAKRT